MSMTPYTGETLTIANIGTTPQERAMETSEFKMAFSKDFHEFVEWFNETHNGEINEHMAESATEEKLGHVIVDGETILVDENGVISSAALTNKNLLHNWDFRNPVNQRGFTSTTNVGYTIDRWRLASSAHTAELVPKGIKITASSSAGLNLCFQQFIENFKGFEGETLTLSMHIVENTLTQGCNLRWNEYASPVIMGTGYFSSTFTPSSLSYIGVQFANKNVDDGKYVIIDKMKLEIGNVSTLANDPPAVYSEQLAFCGPVVDTIAPTNYIGQDGQWQVY